MATKDFTFMLVLFINIILGGICTEYLFETIGRLIERPIDMHFGVAVVIGLFFGELTIPAAILLYVFMLFI